MKIASDSTLETGNRSAERLAELQALESKILWLATWTVHHANHLRPKLDGLKVGGHQASCASIVTLMTALYFDVLRPQDRVAVKPHASPVFHAIQYLFGRQSQQNLARFRAFGGAQSYPSRTKDADDVDFSTGSVGLGVAMTTFASIVQNYVRARHTSDQLAGRMVALLGDAEFDEGNVFEAMLEGWKHDVRNVWWVVDYNRQSLDGIVADQLFQRMEAVFRDMEWEVVTLKYGRALERAFRRRGGDALHDWLDACPNSTYSALSHAGGDAWRGRLILDLGDTSGIRELLAELDDGGLQELMTNLGGHDLETVLDAFRAPRGDHPTCFLAYTIKGHRLPFAGHKDNHAGLMSLEQMAAFRATMKIPEGQEWDPFAGLAIAPDQITAALANAPFNQPATRRHRAPRLAVPDRLTVSAPRKLSTQDGFGRLLSNISREHPALADHIVTTSPDVSVSTSLGPWVNRRGVFGQTQQHDSDAIAAMASPQKWVVSPAGQHIELGIAENNLFILLAALGLSGELFGQRLLPIGTVYDPFINRGLDALNYACYQDARFILVATPAGLTLAPEGGAHQSVFTPLVGMGQPSLTSFEPAYVDELAEMMRWSLEHLQAETGGSVYLRLSTRPLDQPSRQMTPELSGQIICGAYWLIEPAEGAELAIAVCGPVVPEAFDAHARIAEDVPGLGLLVITSADRLHQDWMRHCRSGAIREECYLARVLSRLSPRAGLVTVLDGHAATLSWIGAIGNYDVLPLGVERFGQSGNIPELYRTYGLDADAIVEAAARLCLKA